MQPTTDNEGRKRFLIGPVEMWIIALIPAALGWMLVENWRTASSTISEQGKAIVSLSTSVERLNTQLTILNGQLSDLPKRTAVLEADVATMKGDIQELRRRQ